MKSLVVVVIVLAACSSPEANRTRGGDAGADPGNRDAVVELHAGAQPYYDTPCRMADVKCPKVNASAEDRDGRHD